MVYALPSYELSWPQALVAPFCYSYRHWEEAKADPAHALGHRIISVLEAIPVIGALVALIERIIAYVKTKKMIPPPVLTSTSPSGSNLRILTIERAEQKMVKNGQKAVREHSSKDPSYVTTMPAIQLGPQPPVTLRHCDGEEQGIRPSMEDAHFFATIEQGSLMGVFDGHGGRAVADEASRYFQHNFSRILTERNGNVMMAFEQTMDDIHKRVKSKDMGSTAVVSFIDKTTNIIYTATLADSEANIYRRIDGTLKSIPLSCVRDWSSSKDAIRAGHPEWRGDPNPKHLRMPFPFGVNVSRALGDGAISAVSHKPKITMAQLQPGDLLILACDGLKDYVKESEIVSWLSRYGDYDDRLAKRLAQYAVNTKNSRDNVTVLAVSVS